IERPTHTNGSRVMVSTSKRTVRLGLEALESREMPATSVFPYQNPLQNLTDGSNAVVRTDDSVARSENGLSVVVWRQINSGSADGIYARVFDSSGGKGNRIKVAGSNSMIYGSEPSVDMGADGRFVVAWTNTSIFSPSTILVQ